MPIKVFVEATHEYAKIINDPLHAHPIDGVLREGGSWWTKDEHTCRLQRDGVLTHDGVDQDGVDREGDHYQHTKLRAPTLPRVNIARAKRRR